MFISKTDPNAKSLFNRCIKDLNVNDAVWYICQPLAKRTYSGFTKMPEGKHSDLPRFHTQICQQVLPRTLFHLVFFLLCFVVYRRVFITFNIDMKVRILKQQPKESSFTTLKVLV
jgi:hypothetical protein